MPEEQQTTAKVSASISGGSYSPEGLSFELAVNSFPTVSVSVAEATDKPAVIKPGAASVFERIGQLQEERLAGRTSPDFFVQADDGIGNAVSFNGYISAPVLDLTESNTADKFSAVGEAALLDALDLSIYVASTRSDKEETDSDIPQIPEAEDGNIIGVIQGITEYLVKGLQNALDAETRPLGKELINIQHAINQNGPLSVLDRILYSSDVTYEKWAEAFEVSNTFAIHLTDRTKTLMESKTPGFWGKVNALMSSFQMYYVPEFDGVGRFEKADKKMEDPEGTIKASVSALTVADGSPRLLQPGGVVMMARGSSTDKPETSGDVEQIVAFAPNPLHQGYIQRESAPFWLLSRDGRTNKPPELIRESEVTKVSLSLAQRETDKKKGVEFQKEVEFVSEGIMTEMCETMFKEIQLAHSTATMRLPLDFSLNQHLGKRVTIEIEEGGQFTAFVNSISHALSLHKGSQMSTGSTVRLTHAKYS